MQLNNCFSCRVHYIFRHLCAVCVFQTSVDGLKKTNLKSPDFQVKIADLGNACWTVCVAD